MDAGIILEHGMISAMNYVGDGFAEGKFFIPEMLLSGQTMEVGVKVLKPHLLEGTSATGSGKVLLGTVAGDLHDIGKNIVATMPKMKQTIDAVVEAGLREKIKIIVGGAPVTSEFAKKIGADGYAETAGSAARIAQDLIAS